MKVWLRLADSFTYLYNMNYYYKVIKKLPETPIIVFNVECQETFTPLCICMLRLRWDITVF
jgi:hypothetical protein